MLDQSFLDHGQITILTLSMAATVSNYTQEIYHSVSFCDGVDVLGGGVAGYLCFLIKTIDRKIDWLNSYLVK